MVNGLTGLANLGNTCYINSCMQILSHCDLLNDLLSKINMNKLKDNNLIFEWKELNDLMWNKNCVIAPNKFLKNVQITSKRYNMDLFTGFAQNDLHEFLIFLIDCFHNSIKRKVLISIEGNVENDRDKLAKDCYSVMKQMYSESFSEFLSIFYGIHVTLIKSKDNKLLSHKPEPFSIIDLPIPETNDTSYILDCFDLYLKGEELNGDNAWYDEKNNMKRDVIKSIGFWSLPDILILHLKRFNNMNRKINKTVVAPIKHLDLSKYVIGYNKESYEYEMFGVCNHSGGCLGGHYTANVKNENKWYNFNDTSVTEISENSVVSAKSYCFFYKRSTM